MLISSHYPRQKRRREGGREVERVVVAAVKDVRERGLVERMVRVMQMEEVREGVMVDGVVVMAQEVLGGGHQGGKKGREGDGIREEGREDGLREDGREEGRKYG
ncbi:hypothetical protein Pmani_032198 [Petrolisthes manimaculis]|uniref:Uncharacterized protein n=1 Tax=Petrolisthes manimaculis TaxID=1843537 RepID=A0AAE1TU07_9EUCA|nr:hypothetical protein Pmani_032198 [Petrolisthes manimaculis]